MTMKKDEDGTKAETGSFSGETDLASWKTIKTKYYQVLG